jgi:DNA-binding NtrC family response regulator
VSSGSLPRILVIDDETFIRDLLRDYFTKSGYEVTLAHDGTSGIAEICHKKFDVVLVDLKMPDKNGTEVLSEIRAIDATLPVIMMTGYPTIQASIEAKRLGAHDLIMKPFRLSDLKDCIERAIHSRDAGPQVDQLPAREQLVQADLLHPETASSAHF